MTGLFPVLLGCGLVLLTSAAVIAAPDYWLRSVLDPETAKEVEQIISEGSAVLSVPDSVAVADITGGSSPGACTDIAIGNTGSGQMTGLSIAAPTGDFQSCTPSGTACGATLAVGASCNTGVQAVASDNGSLSGSLVVSADGDLEETASLTALASGFLTPGTTFRDCDEAEGCPLMVVIPSGSFTMGAPTSDTDSQAVERPQHTVTIAYEFAVGVHEVTRGEFRAFVDDTGYTMPDHCWTYEGGTWADRAGRNWLNPAFTQTDDHPVVCANWNNAQTYISLLTDKTGETYRLLSESEWEYVTRAQEDGTSQPYSKYWWGDGITTAQANYKNSLGRTQPVGSYAANAFGLYDVHGNVCEWSEDCWDGSANYGITPTDGSAQTTTGCTNRVVRGGSWYNDPSYLRSAYRGRIDPGLTNYSIGFRLARTITP